MFSRPRSKFYFTTLTTASALGLIECGSATVERTVLAHTIPVPAPSTAAVALPNAPLDPASLARWGGREATSAPQPAPDTPPGAHIILRDDPTKGWRLPSNHTGESLGIRYRINPLGMRGPPLPRPQPGTARLLTLGDSSIYGDTVDEADVFSQIAATQLSSAWECPVVPINGGVPGYTSTQALTWMRELWSKARPDVVVMGTMWSDIYPEDRRPDARTQPLRRLATYRVLRMLLSPWLSAQKVRWIDSRDDLVADSSEAAVPLPVYLSNLRQAATFAQDNGAEMVFLALPAPIDLDRAPVPEIIQEYRAAMALVAQEAGSLFVDGPDWLDREDGGFSLFNDNVHPSASGHALVGYALAQALAQRPAPCR